jgi:hypothetical protein
MPGDDRCGRKPQEVLGLAKRRRAPG